MIVTHNFKKNKKKFPVVTQEKKDLENSIKPLQLRKTLSQLYNEKFGYQGNLINKKRLLLEKESNFFY